MTIDELISELSNIPGNTEILVRMDDLGDASINKIQMAWWPDDYDDHCFAETNEEELIKNKEYFPVLLLHPDR